MADRTFRHNGVIYQVPEEATDEMIMSSLGIKEGDSFEELTGGAGAALAGAEEIKPAHPYQQPIDMIEKLGLEDVGRVTTPSPYAGLVNRYIDSGEKTTLPSQETLDNLLPAAASTVAGGVGLAAGGPPLGAAMAGLGGGAGEAWRMERRKDAGFAPATGFTQEMLSLDPNSKLAEFMNVLAETTGGAVTEGAAPLMRGMAGGLKRKAVEQYARGLGPRGLARELKLTEKMLKLSDEDLARLPVGTLGRIERKVAPVAKEAFGDVGKVYDSDELLGFGGATERLSKKADDLIRAPGHIADTEEFITPDIIDPKAHKALKKRERALQVAESKMRSARTPPTVRDVHKARMQADKEAIRAKSNVYDPAAKDYNPTAEALIEERRGLSETLHGAVKGGAAADARAEAWSAIENTAKGGDVSHFMARWGLSRLLGGPIGTVAGVGFGAPAMIRTPLAKLELKMYRAIKAGDNVAARQAARGMMDLIAQPDTEPIEESE